jgi:hypothetical protein
MESGTAPSKTYRQFISGTRVRGRDDEQCPVSLRGRIGTVLGYYVGSGCLVRFDDGAEEYAYVHWLETLSPAQTESATH